MYLLLFDIDGTLIWSKGAGRAATREAMIEVYGTCANIDTHVFSGKTDWQTLHEQLCPAWFTPEQVEAGLPAYDDAMGRHLERMIGSFTVEPCTGAQELIADLQARDDVLLGIVTGNVPSATDIKLRAGGFDPAAFIIRAYGSERMNRDHLPTLAIERAVARAEREFPLDRVYVIGDTAMDVRCARAAGAVAVGVGTGFEAREALIASKPDIFLEDLTQFYDYIALETVK